MIPINILLTAVEPQGHHHLGKSTIERQATKFILADYDSDYKTRLLRPGILPLMHILDNMIFFC